MSDSRTSEPKVAVSGVVNACFHEGCRWKELTEENRRLREEIERQKARFENLRSRLQDVYNAARSESL